MNTGTDHQAAGSKYPERYPATQSFKLLTNTERFAFFLGDVVARRFKTLATIWGVTAIGFLVWLCIGRRLKVGGLEHLRNVTREGQILLLANHRSIFDFFVIIGAIIWQTHLPRRWFFPVRSNFAYDNLIGICVNLFMTGMSMFPPILYGRRGDMFNRYSLARTVEELATPGTLIGMHPEGMRSRTPNPYQLRPAQPGIGRVALEAKAARAFPVCVIGPTKGLLIEFWRNWMAPDVYPIHVLFGPEIDISDLRAQGSRPTTQKLAADRCLAAVASLVEMEQAVPKKDL